MGETDLSTALRRVKLSHAGAVSGLRRRGGGSRDLGLRGLGLRVPVLERDTGSGSGMLRLLLLLGPAVVSRGRVVAHGGHIYNGARSPGVVPLGRIDAGADEEDKVDEPEKDGEDARSRGHALASVVAVVVALFVLVYGRVPAAAVVVVFIIVVSVHGKVGGLDAADKGGREPDEEADADMGARVHARLPLADGANDELDAAPDDADGGKRRAAQGKDGARPMRPQHTEPRAQSNDTKDNAQGMQNNLGPLPRRLWLRALRGVVLLLLVVGLEGLSIGSGVRCKGLRSRVGWLGGRRRSSRGSPGRIEGLSALLGLRRLFGSHGERLFGELLLCASVL
jgi:hypothetical protein